MSAPWLPRIDLSTGAVWNRLPDGGGWIAYIIGESEGKRYWRAMEVTSPDLPERIYGALLVDVLTAVHLRGPSACTLVEDGGVLPREYDQAAL